VRVLITGGAGFIVSHHADWMLSRGDDEVAIEDFSSGSPDNIAHLRADPRFECVVGSASDASVVAPLVAKSDAIVHLAAAVGVRLILESPVRTIENNLFGTAVVLTAAADAHMAGSPKTVLLASTSEVYGKGNRPPFREDDDLTLGPTTNSRWAYACSKAMDEWLALAHWREHGLPVTIARFVNTDGPRLTGRYGMVLPNFTDQALAGEPITVFGSGRQSRCFCHVSDTVEAIIRLLDTPGTDGQVFNVGSDREISMNDLADMVRREANSSSPIELVPYEEAYAEGFEDMERRVPDCSKMEKWTGFRPKRSLEQIIADVIADRRVRLTPT
jgi:UDP-glucose 4-epimerase